MLRAFTQVLAGMLFLTGCQNSAVDPYLDWPVEGSYFPYIYTPETDLQDYELVRFETETWDPAVDFDMVTGYAKKAIYHRPGAPLESVEHFESMRRQIPRLAEGARLSFVGDLLWVGDNWSAFALPTAGLFDADLRIGNLETPTSPLHTTDRSQMGLYQFNSPVEMLDGLPLDVLQLNNNHSLDFADEALEATVAEVEKRGFVHTGFESHAIVKVKDFEIALLSYTWGINRRDISSSHELFVIPFGHIDQDIDLTALIEDVVQARAQVDSVVVLVHWGFEYEYYPDPHFMVLARAIIAAGADHLDNWAINQESERLDDHLGTRWKGK